MKPVIGLNCDIALREADGKKRPKIELWLNYAAAVEKAGGVPVLLPPIDDDGRIRDQLAPLHGAVLVGGGDYDPALYDAQPHPRDEPLNPIREAYDLKLTDAILERGIPLLAICGGMQLVNIRLGGRLEQHLADLPGGKLWHDGRSGTSTHEITITAGSRLATITGATKLAVNSTHHQAVSVPGRGLVISARSADGIIEALEIPPAAGFLICVQWHPERLADQPKQLALFEALIDAARGGHRCATR